MHSSVYIGLVFGLTLLESLDISGICHFLKLDYKGFAHSGTVRSWEEI